MAALDPVLILGAAFLVLAAFCWIISEAIKQAQCKSRREAAALALSDHLAQVRELRLVVQELECSAGFHPLATRWARAKLDTMEAEATRLRVLASPGHTITHD